MLRRIFLRAHRHSLIDSAPEAAVDATRLETRHVSRHFESRRGKSRFLHRAWPKLTLVCHTATHLIAGAIVSRGPSQDSPDFAPGMRQASKHIDFDRIWADCGYDGEHNHVLCREELHIRSTVIKLNPRKWPETIPKAKCRRQMNAIFIARYTEIVGNVRAPSPETSVYSDPP